MSYRFGMFFKQLDENEDPLSFICKIKTEVGIHAKEMIGHQIPVEAIPSFRKSVNVETDEHWIQHVFNLRFVYWPEKHLLGLSGYDFTYEVNKLFDTHFSFQNSTDQDYDFDCWSDKINVFRNYKQRYMFADLKTLCKDNPKQWYTLEEVKEDPDYYRKTMLYEKIYEDVLHLDHWLYNEPDEKFVAITVNPIDSDRLKFQLQKRIQDVIKKEKLDDYELF